MNALTGECASFPAYFVTKTGLSERLINCTCRCELLP